MLDDLFVLFFADPAKWGDVCADAAQCAAIMDNSDCIAGKCDCKKGYYIDYDKCLAGEYSCLIFPSSIYH